MAEAVISYFLYLLYLKRSLVFSASNVLCTSAVLGVKWFGERVGSRGGATPKKILLTCDYWHIRSLCFERLTVMAELETAFVFNDAVPISFRVVLLLELGIFLWYGLVWACYNIYRINILSLVALSYSPHKYSHSGSSTVPTGKSATDASADLEENILLLNGIRKTLKLTAAINFTGLVAYWTTVMFSESDSYAKKATGTYIPTVLVAITIYRVFGNDSSMGQSRVYTSIKRVLVGNINSSTMRTNDILISDSLTSYSKVLNDLCIFLWVTYLPTEKSYNPYVEALVLAFPGLIRVKQCWFEYNLTLDKNHFYNLIKYSFQLGPLFVNLMIKLNMAKVTDTDVSTTLSNLNFWWYALSTASSTYSFLWDIRMDWGFGMFNPLFRPKAEPFQPLRPRSQLVYNSKLVYYAAIVIDFILRFVWVFKIFVMKETEIELGIRHRVGNFLFGYDFLSFGFVVLEVLEIFRRWLWCFFKLESDLVKLQLKDNLTHAIPLAGLE